MSNLLFCRLLALAINSIPLLFCILYLCSENHTKNGMHFTPRKSVRIILHSFWNEYHTLLGMNYVTSEITPNLVLYFYFRFCCVLVITSQLCFIDFRSICHSFYVITVILRTSYSLISSYDIIYRNKLFKLMLNK